jgi:hypothetical protein
LAREKGGKLLGMVVGRRYVYVYSQCCDTPARGLVKELETCVSNVWSECSAYGSVGKGDECKKKSDDMSNVSGRWRCEAIYCVHRSSDGLRWAKGLKTWRGLLNIAILSGGLYVSLECTRKGNSYRPGMPHRLRTAYSSHSPPGTDGTKSSQTCLGELDLKVAATHSSMGVVLDRICSTGRSREVGAEVVAVVAVR